MARDIYIAIMVAEANGRGLHLTADECFALSMDDAIATRAGNGLTEEEHKRVYDDEGWQRIDPCKERVPANLVGYHKDDPDRMR